MKLLSIIVLTKENEPEFRLTLDSIVKEIRRSEHLEELEILIIEKNSSYVKNYKINLPRCKVRIISQKSQGIFSGFNIAIENAESKWIIFINSGDILTNLSRIISTTSNTDNENIRMLCFQVENIDSSGKKIGKIPFSYMRSKKEYLIYKKIFPYFFGIGHQGIAFSTIHHKNYLYQSNNIGSEAKIIDSFIEKALFYEIVIAKFNTKGISSNAPKELKLLVKFIIQRIKNRQYYSAYTLIVKFILLKLNLNHLIDSTRYIRYRLMVILFSKLRFLQK